MTLRREKMFSSIPPNPSTPSFPSQTLEVIFELTPRLDSMKTLSTQGGFAAWGLIPPCPPPPVHPTMSMEIISLMRDKSKN